MRSMWDLWAILLWTTLFIYAGFLLAPILMHIHQKRVAKRRAQFQAWSALMRTSVLPIATYHERARILGLIDQVNCGLNPEMRGPWERMKQAKKP